MSFAEVESSSFIFLVEPSALLNDVAIESASVTAADVFFLTSSVETTVSIKSLRTLLPELSISLNFSFMRVVASSAPKKSSLNTVVKSLAFPNSSTTADAASLLFSKLSNCSAMMLSFALLSASNILLAAFSKPGIVLSPAENVISAWIRCRLNVSEESMNFCVRYALMAPGRFVSNDFTRKSVNVSAAFTSPLPRVL